MAKAKMVKGVAVVAHINGIPVDSDGREVPGGPRATPDTDPNDQPTNAMLAPEDRMANAMIAALARSSGALPSAAPTALSSFTVDDDDSDDFSGKADETNAVDEEGLPTLSEMGARLDSMTNVDDIRAMRRKDRRIGAKPLYAARLAELSGE